MKLLTIALIFCLALSSSPAMARSLKEENKELRSRVDVLEGELAAIKARLDDNSARVDEVKATVEKKEAKPAMRSKYDVTWYGYVKWDANWDTNRMSTGNFARWVLPDRLIGNDAAFSTTARQTRFGFNINGPDTMGGAKTSANIEVDFYGAGGSSEAKPNMRLRQAWMQMYWPEQDLTLRAGNAFDIVAPLNPSTVDFVVRWWAGNTGTRHPIIYLKKGWETSKDHRWELGLGASRTMGDTNGLINGDAGQESGQPTLQGRIGYTFPGINKLKTTIGVAGVSGKDEFDINAATNTAINLKSQGTFVDVTVPINKRLILSGEYFRGKNLDDFTGGIGQGTVAQTRLIAAPNTVATTINGAGFNSATMTVLDAQELEVRGGWLQLAYDHQGPWKYYLGTSLDRVLNTTRIALPGSTRMENRSTWGAAWYDINENTQFALEYSRWFTDYAAGQDGHSNRLNSALIFKF